MRCPDTVKCLASHFRIPVSHLSAVRRTGGKKVLVWREFLVHRTISHGRKF
jgi:hypothetical protein